MVPPGCATPSSLINRKKIYQDIDDGDSDIDSDSEGDDHDITARPAPATRSLFERGLKALEQIYDDLN
jgi:hypothetical protein